MKPLHSVKSVLVSLLLLPGISIAHPAIAQSPSHPTNQSFQIAQRRRTLSWRVGVHRNNRNSDTVYIGSWIQRLNPDQMKPAPGFNPKLLVQELARASEIENPLLYSELGIWQDAVTTLIALRQKQPHNQELKEDWGRLLKGAQMSEFTNAPILGAK